MVAAAGHPRLVGSTPRLWRWSKLAKRRTEPASMYARAVPSSRPAAGVRRCADPRWGPEVVYGIDDPDGDGQGARGAAAGMRCARA